MKIRFLRFLCSILFLALLMSCISCSEGQEKPYDNTISFQVMQESIVYRDAFIQETNDQFSNIAFEILENLYGTHLSETQKQRVSAQYKKTVIPIFIKARICEEDLNALLNHLEDLTKDKPLGTTTAFHIYEQLIYTVGSEKAGVILYELSKSIIDTKAEEARTKYEEYGYSWYLEDALRCSSIYSDLCAMSVEKFSAICSLWSMLTSMVLSSPTATETPLFALTDNDFLFLLEYHGSYFLNLNITEEESVTFGSLLSEFIPNKTTTLISSHLYALKKDDYFLSAAKVLPSFASLYASITTSLRTRGEFCFDSTREKNILALIGALLDSEQQLLEFFSATEQYASTQTSGELAAITEMKLLDEATAFIASTSPLDNEQFLTILEELKTQPEEMLVEDTFYNALIARLIAIAPYLTFTLTR